MFRNDTWTRPIRKYYQHHQLSGFSIIFNVKAYRKVNNKVHKIVHTHIACATYFKCFIIIIPTATVALISHSLISKLINCSWCQLGTFCWKYLLNAGHLNWLPKWCLFNGLLTWWIILFRIKHSWPWRLNTLHGQLLS